MGNVTVWFYGLIFSAKRIRLLREGLASGWPGRGAPTSPEVLRRISASWRSHFSSLFYLVGVAFRVVCWLGGDGRRVPCRQSAQRGATLRPERWQHDLAAMVNGVYVFRLEIGRLDDDCGAATAVIRSPVTSCVMQSW